MTIHTGDIVLLKGLAELLEEGLEINEHNEVAFENCDADIEHIETILALDVCTVNRIDEDGDFSVLEFADRYFFGKELILEILNKKEVA